MCFSITAACQNTFSLQQPGLLCASGMVALCLVRKCHLLHHKVSFRQELMEVIWNKLTSTGLWCLVATGCFLGGSSDRHHLQLILSFLLLLWCWSPKLLSRVHVQKQQQRLGLLTRGLWFSLVGVLQLNIVFQCYSLTKGSTLDICQQCQLWPLQEPLVLAHSDVAASTGCCQGKHGFLFLETAEEALKRGIVSDIHSNPL